MNPEEPITSEEAYTVSHNMKTYGGGFVQQLGQAIVHADPENRRRLKKAFPEYWRKYRYLATPKEEE